MSGTRITLLLGGLEGVERNDSTIRGIKFNSMDKFV